MKRFLTRASVAGLSAALVAGVAFIAAPAASAAQIGALSFNGLTSQAVGFTMTTSGACPTTPTLATNFQIRIANDASVVGNTAPVVSANITGSTAGSTISGGINAGGFTAPASATLATFAANNGLGSQLPAGTYRFDLICRTVTSSATLGEFSGRLVVGAGGSISSAGPILNNVSTTTSVTAVPASITTADTTTLTATVTPATAVGSVQFQINGTNVGLVPVSGGTAVLPNVPGGAAGSKTVTANFVGGTDTSNSYSNSSGTTSLVVTPAPAVVTTTGIALSSASVAYPATVTATATVTRATGGAAVAGGTVQFKVDGANFGSPVAVNASGIATSAAIARNAGTYAVTAEYLASTVTGVDYAASTSPSASFVVTAPAFDPDVQYIKTTIPPGTLVISTPYSCATLACDAPGDNPLDLGNMVLNATATEYSAFGAFNGIQVTDTRPGNLSWTVSAISSNLAKVGVAVPNNNEIINAQNVGLTDLTLVSTNSTPATFLGGVLPGGSTAAQNFTGFQNFAAAHVDGADGGSLGLGGSPKVVLHANSGLGTTVTNGVLTITAPTNTLDGVYTGTVTFTIIGS